MNDDTTSKTDLWVDRINTFQGSGLSRKEWCQKNGIPQSTLSYCFRKHQPEAIETETASDTLFAKLPSDRELQFCSAIGSPPVQICLAENIRIEVAEYCPSRLMAALIQALKGYA